MDYRELDNLIDLLGSLASGPRIHTTSADLWVRIKEIGAQFKDTRYPSKLEKDAAWSRFQRHVDVVKAVQERERASLGARSSQHLSAAMNSLRDAEGRIDIFWNGIIFTHAAKQREDLQVAGEYVRKASGLLSDKKHEMLGEHKQQVFARIQEVREKLNLAWSEKKKRGDAKHEEWRRKTEDSVRNNRDRIARLEAVISHKRKHIRDLESKLWGARPDFADRVHGWIAEEETAIRDIEAKVREIEGWISDAEGRLR